MSKFIKGALIQYMPTVLIPLPNVVVFQFNPETIVHSWTPAGGGGNDDGSEGADPTAAKGIPSESFSFTLMLDALEMLSSGSEVAKGIAKVSGINTRIAALEMLQYPSTASPSDLLGTVTAAASVSVPGVGAVSGSIGGAGGAAASRPVPQSQVPAALFVWGPSRIVPVRLTNLTVTEKLYDLVLNPTQAEAQVTLKVLTPTEIDALKPKAIRFLAQAAYKYTQVEREALAVLNYTNAAESIVGMLPL
jgi:hypothetical protein